MLPRKGAARSAACRMINKIGINCFKCFRHIQLRELKQFNIIVGRNAGGKTAFLESLFILAGVTAQLPLQVRAFRGMGGDVQISSDRRAFQALWSDLFHGFNEEGQIDIRAIGTDLNSRELSIKHEKAKTLTQPLGQSVTQALEPQTELVFRWKTAKGETFEARPTVGPKALDFGPIVESFPVVFLTPVWREPPEQNGQRFSELSKVKEGERPIVEAIRRDFSFIEDLSVLYSGPKAVVHASLRSLAQKVPVPLVSDGVNKVLSIYLALHAFERGVVLIDEMENGLYFDIHQNISRSMLEFAIDHHVQLFVTTHSMEYLRSLVPLVEEFPEEFCLLRTTKDNGFSDIEQFDGKHLRAALEQKFEIR